MQDSPIQNDSAAVPSEELQWVQQLLDNPLPPVTDCGPQLLKSLQDSSLPYQAISEMLGKDPVLALNLLNQANVSVRGEESLVKTLHQAVSLLGIDFLEQLLRQHPPLKRELADTAGMVGYHHVLSTSFCAAHIAAEIAQIKLPERQDELYWSALFYGVPFWYLWYFSADKMEAWESSLKQNGQTRATTEETQFNTHLAEVWNEIQATFSLAGAVSADGDEKPLFANCGQARLLIKLASYCPQSGIPRTPPGREEILFLNSPVFIMGFSNILAFQLRRSLHSNLVNKLCRVLATLLKKPLNDTIHWLNAIIVQSARCHHIPHGRTIVEQLLWPAPEQAGNEQTSATPAVTAAKGVESVAKTDSSEIVVLAVTENQHTPETGQAEVELAAEPKLETTPEAEAHTTKTEPSREIDKIEPELSTVAADPPTQPELAPITPPEQAPSKPEATTKPLPAKVKQDDMANLHTRRGNQILFAEVTQTMLQTPAVFKTTGDLMNGATRCITHGIGLPTSVVLLINQQRTRLKGFYATGTKSRPNLAKANIDLTEPGLFKTLMQKPSGIWVKPESSAKVHSMIPATFTEMNKTQDFFLMSCFVKNRPIALIYADGNVGKEAPHLTDYEYSCFKKVCGSVAQVLVFLSQRQRAKTN